MTFLEEESVAASLTHTRICICICKLWGIFFIIEFLIVKLPFPLRPLKHAVCVFEFFTSAGEQ